MKVYVVCENGWEDQTILAIFARREAAEELRDKKKADPRWQWEPDDPNDEADRTSAAYKYSVDEYEVYE